ncbi:transmembrane protein 143-like isoform X2 [Hemitrygon akajei]|uniref:transmembrane protein 143-like isoform X2 n=1 Tax=Hemitrygon akajei TaxID=2704970 RepID=UPI003BFA0C4F
MLHLPASLRTALILPPHWIPVWLPWATVAQLRARGLRVSDTGSQSRGVSVGNSLSRGDRVRTNQSGTQLAGVRVAYSLSSGNGVRVSDSGSHGEGVNPEELEQMPDDYEEHFIPFDKDVLLQLLLKEMSSTSEEARTSLRTLCTEAETATVRQYHAVLEHLMGLYEPINPDRDTLPALNLGEPRQLEQEKAVLRNLNNVMDQANFNELSEKTIQYAMQHHDPVFKSQVSVRLEDYEYIKFWALGLRKGVVPQEMKQLKSSRLFFRRQVKLPQDRSYCKRVIVAAREREGRLVLRSFKDIPLENLEHLLPSAQPRVGLPGRTSLYLSLAAGGAVLFANLTVLGLYGLRLNFALLLVLFGALMAGRLRRLSRVQRERAALAHALVLASRCTSGNGELLAALARRAQQEQVKELMLAHAFQLLLLHQHREQGGPSSVTYTDADLAALLSLRVSEWLRRQSGLAISFRGARALAHLHELGRQLRQS